MRTSLAFLLVRRLLEIIRRRPRIAHSFVTFCLWFPDILEQTGEGRGYWILKYGDHHPSYHGTLLHVVTSPGPGGVSLLVFGKQTESDMRTYRYRYLGPRAVKYARAGKFETSQHTTCNNNDDNNNSNNSNNNNNKKLQDLDGIYREMSQELSEIGQASAVRRRPITSCCEFRRKEEMLNDASSSEATPHENPRAHEHGLTSRSSRDGCVNSI